MLCPDLSRLALGVCPTGAGSRPNSPNIQAPDQMYI